MSVFDIINNISTGKEPIEYHKKDYQQYIINKGFSYFIDSILYVNEVNTRTNLTDEQHYAYMFNSLRKKKRFSKWFKKTKQDNIELVMQTYKYNQKKAEEVIKLLSNEQIDELRERIQGGGT